MNRLITLGVLQQSSNEQIAPADRALFLDAGNEVTLSGSLIDAPSSNKWAARLRVRNLVQTSWDVVFGGGTNGFLALGRDGLLNYRDVSGTWYQSNSSTMRPNDFTGDEWVDLLVFSDGVSLNVSTETESWVVSALSDPSSPQITRIGDGYAAPGYDATIEIDSVSGWDLTSHVGSFDRSTILGLVPSHHFDFNEGSGSVVNDSIGSLTGTIETVGAGTWISL